MPLEPATPKPQVAANANTNTNAVIKRQLQDNFIPGRKAAELVALAFLMSDNTTQFLSLESQVLVCYNRERSFILDFE